jgi:FkbM family methyltransferase
MNKFLYIAFKPIAFFIGVLIKQFDCIIHIDNLKIKYPKFMNNTELGFSIFGTYEKSERTLVKKYIKSEFSVLELGACIGAVSCTINRILQDKTRQVSVEPNPDVYDLLLKNRELNNAKFHIENRIVSPKKEVCFYKGGEAFLGSNSLHKNGNETTIQGVGLSDLIEKYFDFDAIVMDIEGGELEFLENFDISTTSIRVVIFETHLGILTEQEFLECFKILEKYGFKYVDKHKAVQVWERC